MSILGSIISAIFGGSEAKAAEPAAESPKGKAAAAAAKTAGPSMSQVDVAALLDGLKKQTKEKLDWRKSIVDLMKLLKLDSSLAARKKLAQELGYAGDMKDTATMNVWLHKQVMKKLAENGGVVPDDLKD